MMLPDWLGPSLPFPPSHRRQRLGASSIPDGQGGGSARYLPSATIAICPVEQWRGIDSGRPPFNPSLRPECQRRGSLESSASGQHP